jgi:SHS2 domain-containing protein
MTYRFLPDVALADIAFEAESDTTEGLFESCALAITDIMVDPTTLRSTVERKFALEAPDLDRLLYDFLTELIVVKDVDSLLFGKFEMSLNLDVPSLRVIANGEAIDRQRHHLRNDVKAVTMHLFGIKHEAAKWRTTVVLDI